MNSSPQRVADTQPTAFPLASPPGRFLFLDAFVKEGRLVLVSTYYPDAPFDFSEVQVFLDGALLERYTEIGRNEYEPTRAIIYPLDEVPPAESHELVVRYRGQELCARLRAERTAPRKAFAIATLFKYDYGAVETFHRYYREQGVERFYLYYNGPLPAIRGRLPDLEGVTYGEWNFAHRIFRRTDRVKPPVLDPDAALNEHHAQTSLLTMVRHRYLSDCTFLAHVDLDEFLAVEGETVRAHVERLDQPALTARCHWTEVRNPWWPKRWWNSRWFRALLARHSRLWGRLRKRLNGRVSSSIVSYEHLACLWANASSEGERRVKTIYRGDFDGLLGIHAPKPPAQPLVSEELKLYHVVNTGHGRQTLMRPEALPISLITDEREA